MQFITIKENVECQRLLLTLRNLIKIAMVPKANIYEPWWRFEVELLSPAISAGMWFDWRLRHNALKFSGLRTFQLRSHSIIAPQWTGI